MSLDDPVILTRAISGAVAGRDQCPAIHNTPAEYAAEARRIVDEGGAMIHIPARFPDGTPGHEVEDFRAITELRPDVGALNMGSMDYAKYSRRRKQFVFKAVFENSFDTILAVLGAMNECGIRPEHECFDSGHRANLDPLLDMGVLEPPLQTSCVLWARLRAVGRMPPVTPMAVQVPDVPHRWGVIGISRTGRWPARTASRWPRRGR